MRISTILFCMGLIIAVSACFDDKGNYNYKDVNIPEIDTTGGFDVSYSVEQFKNLVIDPKINYAGDGENLSYEWLLYVKSSASDAPPSNVISTSKVFDRPMGETPGTYILELIVKDDKTGITDNIKFDLVIEASVETGWLVLHTANGESDVDFIVTKNAVPTASAEKWLKNLYAKANGVAVKGTGRFITQTRYSSYYLNYINIGTSEDLVRASGLDLLKVNDHTTIFSRGSTAVNSQAHDYHSYFETFISNGSLYMINYGIGAIKSPATIGYYVPVAYSYKIAPYIPDLSSASNTNSASTYQATVLYDTDNLKFIKVPFAFAAATITPFITQTSGPFDVNDIGKEIVYMERAYQNYTYAFFKDVSGAGRWLYVADFYSADAGTVAKAAYDMTGLPEIDNAKFYQCGDLGYVAYYATDNTIYSYDYYGANTATVAYSFSNGEVISSMKIYKPKTFNNLTNVNNRILYVATWNETTQVAKLYEFAIDPTSGIITQTPLNVFEGFDGKIVDMCRKVKG